MINPAEETAEEKILFRETSINTFRDVSGEKKEIIICANCLNIMVNSDSRIETILKKVGNFFWWHCNRCGGIVEQYNEGRI